MRAYDILGGDDLPADVKAYAKQIQEQTAAQPNGSDPDEDVETAKAVVELRSLLEEKRRRIKAAAQTRDTEYDAFGGSKNRSASSKDHGEKRATKSLSSDWPKTKAASEKQIGWFRYKGAEGISADTMTAWRAFVVRELVETYGVEMKTALSYSKNQALAVKDKYEKAAS